MTTILARSALLVHQVKDSLHFLGIVEQQKPANSKSIGRPKDTPGTSDLMAGTKSANSESMLLSVFLQDINNWAYFS